MSLVVGGALANKAGNGGEAWVRLSWIRGFQQLGLDVWFVEELTAEQCVDAAGRRVVPDEAVCVRFFRDVVQRFGLEPRASLLVDGVPVVGPPVADLADLASQSTLVNISGHLAHPELFSGFRRRVLVDIDPGFTQIWHVQGMPGARVSEHDLHFTIGENIGTPGCPIPTGGVRWRPVRQPVVLDDWPAREPPAERDRFTTVSSWRGPFGPVEHDGRRYGLKLHEFRKLLALPKRSPHTFEIALNIDPADGPDLEALHHHGWRTVDPARVAGDPDAFRRYVQGSGGELSAAHGVYVDTASGWISDRTLRYLASGRPAIVQDTGFAHRLPAGEGLVPFRTFDDAVDAVERVVGAYEHHGAAARALAEEHFAAPRVLADFCDEAGVDA
jgi:hypothetical protein